MKEYTINHAFNKVDWLLNRSAIALVGELPEDKVEGDIYLLADGKLALYIDEGWQSLTPSQGTIIYVRGDGKFYLSEGVGWKGV